jgi:ribonuclease HIII
MSSSTQVFQLTAAAATDLRAALNQAGFEFRTLQHALFQARGEGVVASMYRSGKLVVQGQGADAWHTRYLGAQETLQKRTSSTASAHDLPAVADSFGALVVGAVAVPAALEGKLLASRVADSKSLSDDLIRTLAPWLKENFPFTLRVLPPPEYNQRWTAAGRNVNKLLTELHFECLHELYNECGFHIAVVDRFSSSSPVTARLGTALPGLKVVEVPRAERHVAVAAASVIARDAFLTNMEELSAQWALDFPLGSGSPVSPAMRRFVELHSPAQMAQVAKVHFKNVQLFLARN